MAIAPYASAITDFLKDEDLQDVPRVAHPHIAAVGTAAKAVLASPLLRDALTAHGVEASSFSEYSDCAALAQDPTWTIALALAPCKPEAYKLTSGHLAPMAARTQVVDTILRREDTLYGVNTNAYAAQLATRQLLGDQIPATILVAGTSATARSVVVGLRQLYPEARISVVGRSPEKLRALIDVCGVGEATQTLQPGSYELVVNATSIGNSGDEERLDYPLEDTFAPGVYFFDVIIRHTYLQQAALGKGCSVISGAAMQRAASALRAGLLGGK